MNRFAFTAVLVIPLSGCSGGEPDPAVTPNAREVGPIAVTSRGAPKRADGYWQLITIGAGGTEMGKQFLCVGTDSEERGPVFDQIAINVNCSKHDFTRTAAGWNFDTACGPMNATTKGTISGDFMRSYSIELAENDGTMEMKRTVQARHVGSCPSGVAPGDLMDDAGKKIANTLG